MRFAQRPPTGRQVRGLGGGRPPVSNAHLLGGGCLFCVLYYKTDPGPHPSVIDVSVEPVRKGMPPLMDIGVELEDVMTLTSFEELLRGSVEHHAAHYGAITCNDFKANVKVPLRRGVSPTLRWSTWEAQPFILGTILHHSENNNSLHSSFHLSAHPSCLLPILP